MFARVLRALNEERDGASLAALRFLFGALMFASICRYFAMGWIDAFYVEPRFHFTYWGFSWVRPLPEPGMTIVFAALAITAACIALGFAYRAAAITFFVLFAYVHLLDVSNYLNHYYLVSLLALLMCALPLHRSYSIDALLRPRIRSSRVPAWMLWLVRAQVAIVYLYAAFAKLDTDWLVHGQPLGIWLHARTETPVIGPLLEEHWVALAASWAAFLFDLTIVFWLSWKRSRPVAYAVLCGFHFFTFVFFNIGIFPFLMTIAATIFFEPSWPRRFVRSEAHETPEPHSKIGLAGAALVALWLLAHVTIPLRAHLYGGHVNWHEQGMRWSWRVMVREKNAIVSYRVRVDGGREQVVPPSQYLRLHQEREFAGQPDLVLQLAHRIAADVRAEGHAHVEVRADAWASLNGRPSARLIDPNVDLARIEDGVIPATWILPRPEGPPIRLQSTRERLAVIER